MITIVTIAQRVCKKRKTFSATGCTTINKLCGSGMKAAMNGVPNCSILDGWWPEACIHGVNGWAIGNGENDRDDDSSLTFYYYCYYYL